MAKKTVEYAISRSPEMGMSGRPAHGPLFPVDAPEPELDSESMLINIGPQHPATHGTLRIAAKLDGSDLIDLGALPQRAGDPSVLVADTARLRTEVHWQPRISLDDGLDQTIAWWRSKART